MEEKTVYLERNYPEWDDVQIKNVAEGKVEEGMTREMVEEAIGKRGEVKAGPDPEEEEWVYSTERMKGQTPVWEPVYFIKFEDGKVKETKGERQYIFTW